MVKLYKKIPVFLILSFLVFLTVCLVKAGTWLQYDDGTEEGWECITPGEYYAVEFILPEGCDKAELLTVSFFKSGREISGSITNLTITVLGSDFSTELGSFDVQMDPPGGAFKSFTPPESILVSDVFYIVMTSEDEGCIGVDSSTSGHSYMGNGLWTMQPGIEYMVRAEIECVSEAVGGELVPGIGKLLYFSLLILVPLLGVSGYYGYTRNKLQ